ncbi:MAG: polysaccharide deacetylase family protein [Thermodesulfovibrionales bacterium]|nr:polysaccharide deacetylase family protein [Thermodesulfovibrionales bacterium]
MLKPKGIPILAYHSIDNSNSRISISPDIFKVQMEWLKAEGFRVLSLSQLFSADGKVASSGNFIVLTFDDGLRNFYEEAWPVLNGYGFSATVFVPTDFIGLQASWYTQYGLKPLPTLNWQEIRNLKEAGADIQSHGCSHRKLTELSLTEVAREMTDSKKVLEDGVGKSVDFFCYPFGEVNQDIVRIARDTGYRGAACMRQGLYKPGDDLFLLKRQSLDYIVIDDERTAVLSIKSCVRGTFAWYVKTRRKLQGRGDKAD